MNPAESIESRLESLGAALREQTRLKERIMDEVRRKDGNALTELRTMPTPRWVTIRRTWQWFAASAVVLTLGMLAYLVLSPTPAIGWADVTNAVAAQTWIRARVTYLDGQAGELWVSPRQRVWAYKNDDRMEFGDERQRGRYEYDRRRKTLTKRPLGEDTLDRVLPFHDLTAEGSKIGPWMFGTEKILGQKRRELTVDGKRWIEFDLLFWRGKENQGILRVDPVTRLPVYLSFTSQAGAGKSFRWEFDYPEHGPADIYEMGVPRDISVKNRMPSDDALGVLDAIAASRSRIGDFRVVIADSTSLTYLVWRKGERWRVDQHSPRRAARANTAGPQGQTMDAWFEQLASEARPSYRCDGKSVYQNEAPANSTQPEWKAAHVAPHDLLSGDRSGGGLPDAVRFTGTLFPNLAPSPGFGFEFDPRPAGHDGRVLIRVSAQVATQEPSTAHEWYYVDPERGHAVVFAELFTLPTGEAPDPTKTDKRQTILIEEFARSPTGFWYPKVMRNSTPSIDGQDENGKRRFKQHDKTINYHFDFDAELPESLFVIE